MEPPTLESQSSSSSSERRVLLSQLHLLLVGMDSRLFEAARTGDVRRLHQLLQENPLLLHAASLTAAAAQNPLHVAALLGHLDFSKELLRLRPGLANELSRDGFAAAHLAAANGHAAVVRELLKADGSLCRLAGSGMMTPLHLAAANGRAEVIRGMAAECEDCVLEDAAARKEGALHFAVRNRQIEAFRVLVDWAREVRKEDVLNAKDEQGNTILHLAAWSKQRQVIEVLLDNATMASQTIEINAINNAGLTALDTLLIFPSEAGDLEIEGILRCAGAKKARDVVASSPMPSPPTMANEASCRPTNDASLLHPDSQIKYFQFHRGRDPPSEARSTLLVIAVLVATATYQVGINPPGGVWQDNQGPNLKDNNNSSSKAVQFAGKSILASYNSVLFGIFVLFNSAGFYLSLYMINILTSKFPLQLELQICTVGMVVTYSSAVASVAPDGNALGTFVIVLVSVLPTVVPLATKLARVCVWRALELVRNFIHKIN